MTETVKRPRKDWPPLRRFMDACLEDLETGCWNWTKSVRGRYGMFRMSTKTTLAHRTAWELFKGPIPEGKCVLHRCDNRRCVNPKHLFLGTQKDNIHDMMRKGRDTAVRESRRGERSNWCRLTAEKVRIIFTSLDSQASLARRFKVTQSNISRIQNRKSWKAVTNNL